MSDLIAGPPSEHPAEVPSEGTVEYSTDARPLVAELVRSLEFGASRLSRRQLADLVRRVARDERLWRTIVRHDPEHRWYARLFHARNLEIWLLGWERGQDTRFHDHGGSSGAFCVAEGRLRELYGRVESRVGVRDRFHDAGTVCPFGPDYLHDLADDGPGVATSVHAYSPALTTMTYYRLDRGLFVPYETLLTEGPEPEVDPRLASSPAGCLGVPTAPGT
ncbi:MAG: cysteine dioxygenase [Streptosporangiaceae bacterium]